MRILQILFIAVLSITFAVSCTKKRPVKYSQGQGVDLNEISKFDGATYTLKTGKFIAPANVTKADRLKVDKQVKVQDSNDSSQYLNNFGIVEYTTNEDLLGNDLPIVGRANFEYGLLYKVTDNYLKIYKVGNKEDLPYQELAYAEKQSDGKYAVPLVGYSLSLYRTERAKNADDDDTNLIIEIPEKDRDKAAYFKIDRLKRTIFQAVAKIDVYPASFFQGTWYFSESVIAAQEGRQKDIGGMTGFDAEFNSASKVKFLMTSPNAIRVVNVNIDERLKDAGEINYQEVIQIPVQWREYRAVKEGNQTGMREEAHEENEPTSRPYIKMDFEGVSKPSAFGLSAIFNKVFGIQRVIDISISNNHFSFTVVESDTNRHVKFAFLKAGESDYKRGRRWFKSDTDSTFGFFDTRKNAVVDRHYFLKEDYEKNRLLNRFNPNKDIVFNFSNTSPKDEWIREVGATAVKRWDQAFQAAGTNIRVKINTENDVPLGDLRYNTINFVKSVGGSNLNGFGPSLSDPYTGEIIATTANIHVTTILDSMAYMARVYMYGRLGIYNNNVGQLVNSKIELAGFFGDQGSQFSLFEFPYFIYEKGKFKPMELYKYEDDFVTLKKEPVVHYSPDSKLGKMIDYFEGPNKNTDAYQAYNYGLKYKKMFPGLFEDENRDNNSSVRQFGVTDAVISRIKHQCPDLEQFIAKNNNRDSIRTEEDREVIESCAIELSKEWMLIVLLHEMGHNLGLRHNFAGSADRANFYSQADYKRIYGIDYLENELPSFSSVMDYPAPGRYRPKAPAAYDIAAIRFGYTDSVELISGKIKKLDITKSLADNGLNLKPYAYCTDEHRQRLGPDARMGISKSPLCFRWDYGATPTESINEMISEVYNHLSVDNYRFNKVGIMDDGRTSLNFLRLRRFYDEWRILLQEKLGNKGKYLTAYDLETYEKKLAEVTANDPKLAEYKKARDRIFDFFVDVLFLPDRYCIGVDMSGNLQFEEFTKLRETLQSHGVLYADSCGHESIVKLLAEDEIEYLGEVGHPFSSIRYSMSDEDLDEPIDVLGTQRDRLNVLSLILGRGQTTVLNRTRDIKPSMMDEPDLQSKLQQEIFRRLFGGVDMTDEIKANPEIANLVKGDERIIVKKFKYEKDLLDILLPLLRSSLGVPNDESASSRRISRYLPRGERNGVLYGQVKKDAEKNIGPLPDGTSPITSIESPNGIIYYAIATQNDIAFQIINVTNQLDQNLRVVPDIQGREKEFLDTLKPLIDQLPATERDKISGKQLADLVETIGKIMQDPQAGDEMKRVIQVSFKYMIKVFNAYIGTHLIEKRILEQIKAGMDEKTTVPLVVDPARYDTVDKLAEANLDQLVAMFRAQQKPEADQAVSDEVYAKMYALLPKQIDNADKSFKLMLQFKDMQDYLRAKEQNPIVKAMVTETIRAAGSIDREELKAQRNILWGFIE